MCVTLAQEGSYFHSGLLNKQSEVKNKPLAVNLTKINSLKRSVERNPFNVWYFKDKLKSLKDLLTTAENYDTQAVERRTTKHRLQNLMAKVLLGQDIVLTVMGGSISAGGGLINDFSDLRGIYYRVFIDWWRKVIQPYTGSNIKLRNLAVGGTGSNFFAYCYKTLMRPRDSMDITFLEFSVNDYTLFENAQLPRASSLEKLTRLLLSEKSSPVVAYVNFISGNNKVPVCNNLENHGQTMLAWHYGITSFSIRHSLCPSSQNRQFPTFYSSDGTHSGYIAHAQISMMIINSVRGALLKAIESSGRGLHYLPSHNLPRPVYFTDNQGSIPGPLCYTRITPDVTKTFFNPSLSVIEIENTGFKHIRDAPIGFHRVSYYNPVPLRTDGFGGWEAQKVNSTLQLQIDLPSDGIPGQNQTRDFVIAIRTNGFGGKAEVSLDESKHGVLADAYSTFGFTRLITVADHVTPGSYILSFKIVKAGNFSLCGVMAGTKSVANY